MEDLSTMTPGDLWNTRPASAEAALAVIDRIEHELRLLKALVGGPRG